MSKQAEYRMASVAALVPYANNARTHSAEQIEQVAASIREFGFINPVVIDAKGGIVAGHARVLAALQLGLEQVPVLEVGWLSPAQKRAYILADNKHALNAGWDDGLLRIELEGLKIEGFDLSLTGFSGEELAGLFATTEGKTDPDECPAVPAVAVSQPGDVWILGDQHRVICGDSTVPETVAKLLGNERPNLMVTDPPYGVNYDPTWRQAVGLNASIERGAVLNDDRADWREAWRLFPGAVAYVWHGATFGPEVAASLQTCRFDIRAQIVWVKTRLNISRGHYHWQHEHLAYAVADGADDNWRFVPEHEVSAYAVKKGATGNWHGDRKQSTVWFIETLQVLETGHGTQKPVECMKRPIENNSAPGEAVYDPFLGSGTTIIAAEMTGRRCYGIELNPLYVDVCVTRWENFRGASAIRESDGLTFAQVKAASEKPKAKSRAKEPQSV